MRHIVVALAILLLGIGVAGCGPIVKVAEGTTAGHREDQLFDHATHVAIVPVDSVNERINSPDNQYWGQDSAVYREAQVTVERVLKGESPRVILQTGGEVGNFRHLNQGQRYLELGKTYLLFLAEWQAPEKDGSTHAISPVGALEQVAFTEVEPGVWASLDGAYTLTEDELDKASTD